MDMRPLSTIEGDGFKRMFRIVEPRYQPISRATLKEKFVTPMYYETKSKMMEDISIGRRHAFTTDAWTSIANEGFITTTCHYIDPRTMTLETRVLDTKRVTESHTAQNLADEMKKEVDDKWKLKYPVAVTDNAANIVNACEIRKYPHLGCFAHTLNLAVQRALLVPEVSRLVGKCHQIVAFFNRSDQKNTALKSKEAELELRELSVIQDVKTRWNSALMMCRRLLTIFPALYAVLFDRKANHLLLDASETEKLQDLVQVLTPFEEATKMVSSAKSPTAGLVLPIIAQMKSRDLALHDDDSNMIKSVKRAILNDLNKRYLLASEQQLLGLCSVVDPRWKKLSWMSNNERVRVHNALEEEALAVIGEGAVDIETPRSSEAASTSATEPTQTAAEDLPEASPDPAPDRTEVEVPAAKSSFFDESMFGSNDEASVAIDAITKAKNEIDRYMQEPVAHYSDHPVSWWGDRIGSYPILTQVAIRYLPIPATSVPSERVFSTAGNIVSKKRGALNHDTVDMLISLHENYKKYHDE